MKRRDFLGRVGFGLGTAWLGSRTLAAVREAPPVQASAADVVTLGRTGIQTSRLACGTGTVAVAGRSRQAGLGIQGLADLLQAGYDQGLRFIDTADAYGTHPHVAAALKRIPREKVTVLTKSRARDANGMRADLDRFRRELGTDYIDVLLMHAMRQSDWPDSLQAAMGVLTEAREKGIIRTHGVSCHSLEALRAAETPWAQVILVRLNPIGSNMDADPETVLSVLWKMRAAGKGIIGMKILAEGEMRHRVDEALKHAVSTKVLDAFTIGAESRAEQADLIRRIATIAV